MNPTATTAFSTALLAVLALSPAPIKAQDLAYFNTNTTTPAETPSAVLVRTDLVAHDLVTPATKRTKQPYARTVTQRADGLYEVRITDASGQERMHGTYRDSELKVAHGAFEYRYANGRMESAGEYKNGLKKGIWKCATATGESRADRYYHGLEWDDLEVAVGLATRAN